MFSLLVFRTSKPCRLSAGPLAASPTQGRHNLRQLRCVSTGAWRPASALDDWVARESRPISLRQLMVFGRSLTEPRLISSANYVRTELPVRIAHRLRDLQCLPYVVVSNQHIKDVYDLYYNAFDTLRKFGEVKTLEDNDKLCDLISKNLRSHLTVIPKLAQGILECGELMDPKELDQFMNTILRSRMSRRVIAEQHLALTEAFKSPDFSPTAKLSESDFIGKVFIKCSAKDVVDRCAEVVRTLARSTNGPGVAIPEVRVVGHLDASFPYILSHIEYIIGELLRNSVQAVVDHQQTKSDGDSASETAAGQAAPPIEVTLCETQEHVIFRISDQGGGIPKDQLPHLWSFSKGPCRLRRLENLGQVPRMAATLQELLTHDDPAGRELKAGSRQNSLSPLTFRPPNLRLGIGLPLSRVYAEYWAGSLHVHSLAGYGVDAFLQISRLGNKNEQLATRASMDGV